MRNILKKSMILFLRLYKLLISNYLYVVLLGGGCRYQKPCSEFAIEAVNEEGIRKGLSMSIRRFLSCQPFSRSDFETIKDLN